LKRRAAMTTDGNDTAMQPEEPMKGPIESEPMETETDKEVPMAVVELVVVVETDKGDEGESEKDRVMEDVESPAAPPEQEETTATPLETEPEPDTITPFDTDAEIQSVFKSMESLRAVRSQLIIV
jgi:hypothetical protein